MQTILTRLFIGISAIGLSTILINPSVKASGEIDNKAVPLVPERLQQINKLAGKWLKRPELQHSLVGLEIMHLPSEKVLYAYNNNKRFTPASVTKVFTAACALDLLGADYRYKTSLKYQGNIKGSVLTGILYLEPSQDPAFSSENLRTLVSALAKQGIKKIEGTVDLKLMPGNGDRFEPSWLLEDWGQEWMPVPADFVLDGNVTKGHDPARGYPLTAINPSHYGNSLILSAINNGTGQSWVSFNPDKQTVELWQPGGSVMGGLVVGNPNSYNLAIFKKLLTQAGIKINEKPGDRLLKAGDHKPATIAEHQSEPLTSMVRLCLKESDNLYAQQILRTLGASAPGNLSGQEAATSSSGAGTLEARGIAVLTRWLAGIGVTSGDVILYDGCGLSRKNCFTPHALNIVHRYMSANPAYINVMPCDTEKPQGSFHYKTGAMDSVRTITGILMTGAGEPLALTVMVNAHTPSIRQVKASMQSLISHLESLGALPYDKQPIRKPSTKAKAPTQPTKIKKPGTPKMRNKSHH